MKLQDYCIYPKKNKKGVVVYYYTTYDENGKRHSYSTGTDDRRKAQHFVMDRLSSGTLIPESKINFKVYAKDFFNFEISPYIKAKIARGYTVSESNAKKKFNFINKIAIPYFKDKRIDCISPSDIESFLQSEKSKGKSNSTINNEIKILKSVFTQAKKEHFLSYNPLESIEPFKNDTKEKGVFSKAEVTRLFSEDNFLEFWKGDLESYLFNRIAVSTGMRIGEIQALKITDINKNCFVVSHSWTEGYGLSLTKTRNIRYIPIPSRIQELLKEYIGKRKYGYIFSHTAGKTPITRHLIYKNYKQAMANAGLIEDWLKWHNITFHSWRHTFASILANDGAPELFIRKLTGHQSSAVFHNYTHADIEEMRKYVF